jgi:AcrR family transcriptional regulator
LADEVAVPGLTVAPPRPDQGKRETVKRILSVARQEFAAKGLARARIDEIAQQAGVTKQLVHHYFGTKEKLFAHILDESAFDIMSELLAMEFDEMSPADAVRYFLRQIFEQYRCNAFLGALASEGMRYHENHSTPGNRFVGLAPALLAKLDAVLKRGVACGDFRPDVDPRLFLASAALLISGGFTNRYSVSALVGFNTATAEGMDAWHRHAVDFIIAAIRAPCAQTVASPNETIDGSGPQC